MATIFTKIINGEIPCFKLYEDDQFFAFLDIHPLAKGHTLVVPKQEVDYIFDLDPSTYLGLMEVAKKVAKGKGEIKLNVSDIINRVQYFYQNANSSNAFQKNIDAYRFTRRFGTAFNVSINYSL